MCMLTFYADESGTDSHSPIAVVGGLLLRPTGFFWLDVEWRKVQSKYGTNQPIHMREFGAHGAFGKFPADERQRLLADLVCIINEHKVASAAATLDTEKYRGVFAGITDYSLSPLAMRVIPSLIRSTLKLMSRPRRLPASFK
jgi:hypothetical protein